MRIKKRWEIFRFTIKSLRKEFGSWELKTNDTDFSSYKTYVINTNLKVFIRRGLFHTGAIYMYPHSEPYSYSKRWMSDEAEKDCTRYKLGIVTGILVNFFVRRIDSKKANALEVSNENKFFNRMSGFDKL